MMLNILECVKYNIYRYIYIYIYIAIVRFVILQQELVVLEYLWFKHNF